MTTWAVGDIHGDLAALESLLAKLLPRLVTTDTLVFLGDYVDRGPDSKQVVERVRQLEQGGPCKVVALRGNHEDTWAKSFQSPNPAFLLHRGNGCAATWRSFTGRPPLESLDDEMNDDDLLALLNVPSWLPPEIAAWMAARPAWYEDAHAIYVHAGLDNVGEGWCHPSEGREKPLFWMRDPDFFAHYQGRRVVFGHTRTKDLPHDHQGYFTRVEDPAKVWLRGDLVGVDTGAGMGGYLSAVSMADLEIIESR